MIALHGPMSFSIKHFVMSIKRFYDDDSIFLNKKKYLLFLNINFWGVHRLSQNSWVKKLLSFPWQPIIKWIIQTNKF
jgi:hypothetical protein